ncbi:MAG TPA: ABC transporter permease, partial [Gaiellaceae bacterium]|nr:ABC transporter permease [Gaiellaceae bacterium]
DGNFSARFGVYTGVIAFLLRRVTLGVLVLAALSCASFCFFAWQSPPGSTPFGGPAVVHGSLVSQWWSWVRGLWHGSSYAVMNAPTFTRNFTFAGPTMFDSLGHTVALLAATLLLVVAFAVLVALVSASRQGSALDVLLRGLSYLAWAVPAFLLALLVEVLVNKTVGPRWTLPLAGWPGQCPAAFGLNRGFLTPCPAAASGLDYVWNVVRYTTLPALTLAVGFVGLHARYLRSALVESLDQQYVTTARAKGLTERRVLLRHALRTSLVTFSGALLADVGAIFGGAMAVDYVFQFNGLGTLFVSAFPVDIGSVNVLVVEPLILMTAVLVIVSSILSDLVVLWLDPRVRAA